ncbi:Ovate domain-containing protein [Cephalotus follicularis]|uniref:Transcription repressor n=1 Tax=Cephalotus follicularis TaxID=3775 RepID=A0A1Q3APU5_CEPFO|nr:Ovate domain-containing protein [Cephalotus follicularis]
MPGGTLGRNLNLCFTKIKSPMAPKSPHTSQPPDDSLPTSALINNYNSLYDHNNFIDSKAKSDSHEPDFASIYASGRFFFTSPGSSNSIFESTPSITTTPDSSSDTASCAYPIGHSTRSSVDHHQSQESLHSWTTSSTFKDGVAVSTYSPDPYGDFRRSMQEMVEARHLIDIKANWDYLHELLLCYLALNPKTAHKYIIGAFADLLVSLMPLPAVDGGIQRESEFDAGGCRF